MTDAALAIALLANGRLEIVRRGGQIEERKWLRLGGNWIEPVEWKDGVPVLSERVRALFTERLKAVEEFFK